VAVLALAASVAVLGFIKAGMSAASGPARTTPGLEVLADIVPEGLRGQFMTDAVDKGVVMPTER